MATTLCRPTSFLFFFRLRVIPHGGGSLNRISSLENPNPTLYQPDFSLLDIFSYKIFKMRREIIQHLSAGITVLQCHSRGSPQAESSDVFGRIDFFSTGFRFFISEFSFCCVPSRAIWFIWIFSLSLGFLAWARLSKGGGGCWGMLFFERSSVPS